MNNIAILVASLKSGGAERIAGFLSVHLSKKYNVYIFIGDSDDIAYEYAGVLADYSVNGRDNLFATVRELKKSYKIDYAISFDFAMNIVNIMTKNDECVIISQRCTFSETKPYPYRIAAKTKRWYRFADKIVSLSYGVTEELIKNFGIKKEKIATIYNFIDKTSEKIKANEELPTQITSFVGSSKLILNVGRLDPQKNQKKLLVQFSKLCNDYDIKLIILGSGRMETELKSTAYELGIMEKVLFVPYCANPFPYYKLASIFVLSSDYEGYGNVVIEAMINHTPCVCVDCFAGPREIIKGCSNYSIPIVNYEICERGILVEKADTDSDGQTSHLSDAIKAYLDDDELMKSIVRHCDMYIDRFSNKKLVDNWIETIENTETGKMTQLPYVYPELNDVNKVIVYGVGFLGKLTMRQLASMNLSNDKLCFAVSDKSSLAENEVMGYPVYELKELSEYKNEAIVFVGVTTVNNAEEAVISNLVRCGFNFTFPDLEIDYY